MNIFVPNGRRLFQFNGRKYRVCDLAKADKEKYGKLYYLQEIKSDGKVVAMHNKLGWDLPMFSTINEAQRFVREWDFLLEEI